MGVVKGAISIKDNMTAVLRSIKDEQTAFLMYFLMYLIGIL